MASINYILSLMLIIFVGCSTSITQKIDLNELQISSRPKPSKVPFERFYKTMGIKNIEISNNEKDIYFLKKDGKSVNIFNFNTETKLTNKMTTYNESVKSFSLGPKGKYAFVMKDKGGNEIYDIYRFNLQSKTTKQLTFSKKKSPSYLCDISKDGKRMYYSKSVKMWSFSDVNVMNLTTLKSKTLLKSNNKKVWECGRLDSKERYIAINNIIDNNEIHAGYLDLKTSEVNMYISEKEVKNTNLRFHNDNIYFLSTKDSDKTRIWKYDIASKQLQVVKRGNFGSVESFDFYENGKTTSVKYRGTLNGEFKIFSGIFQKEKKLHAPLSDDLKKAIFMKDNSKIGVGIVSNSSTPPQFYYFRDNQSQLFFDSNKSGIDNKFFSKGKSILVKSFDGIQVPTHFYIPNGTSKNNKKPAILFIHGGPEDHWDKGYNPIFQYWTNRGFVIVTPNVRGSSGFGKKYMFMDNGDWGGNHIKDILAVSEYTKTLDFVDNKNIFLAGGSFGGFSVMSLITQYPKVFKAAVCLYGIMEFESFIKTLSPMAQEYFITELGTDPRKDAVFNKKVSPFYHIGNIEIPLQVQHGANDSRIPLKQAEMIVSKLKNNNKPVDFIVFDNEGHGFQRFKNMKKSFSKLADFFSKHSVE